MDRDDLNVVIGWNRRPQHRGFVFVSVVAPAEGPERNGMNGENRRKKKKKNNINMETLTHHGTAEIKWLAAQSSHSFGPV